MKLNILGKNKAELLVNGCWILFSYHTPVAAILKDGKQIRTNKKWSVTTSKHIGKWRWNQQNVANIVDVPQEDLDGLCE